MTISLISSRSVSITASDSLQRFVQTSPTSQDIIAKKPVDGEEDTATVQSPSPTSEHVAQAVKQVNDAFAQKGKDLHAVIEKDKGTGINVVKVVDKNTDEVISQFPSKEIIAIAEAIKQYQEEKGYLLDTSA